MIEEKMRFLISASLLLLLGLGACKPTPPSPPDSQGPVTLAIPEKGAYTGAYIDFGEKEDDVTLEAIEDFEQLVGKHQAIVASSSYWGEQTFPTANVNIIWRHGSIPLVFWSPWDEPYGQECPPDRFALTTVLEGKWDAYIDRWADAACAFGHPLMVSFANEMNGTWFPWSGYYYGGGSTGTVCPSPLPIPAPIIYKDGYPVPGPPCPRPFMGPETFKKAYRYIVDRVRARGAHNIQWVFHVTNYSMPQEPWNFFAEYYPGTDYVDWLGASIYGEQFDVDPWNKFSLLIEGPYKELCAVDPQKPLMLAEWGVGEYPKKGSKPEFLREALGSLVSRYPRIKAAVFWHERWQNPGGYYSNLRANSSPESLAAYRRGVANPLWLDKPILVPLKAAPSPALNKQ